jgi:nondiscriminating aspartyl-tRNA synthetase
MSPSIPVVLLYLEIGVILMKRSYVAEVMQNDLDEVLLKGWVHRITGMGKIAFVGLRDRTGIIQLVLEGSEIERLRLEMCIAVKGNKVANEKAPGGAEVHATSVEIIGKAYYDMLPFQVNNGKVKASLETQLDYRTISLRAPKMRAVFKGQQEIEDAFKNYLRGKGLFTDPLTKDNKLRH